MRLPATKDEWRARLTRAVERRRIQWSRKHAAAVQALTTELQELTAQRDVADQHVVDLERELAAVRRELEEARRDHRECGVPTARRRGTLWAWWRDLAGHPRSSIRD